MPGSQKTTSTPRTNTSSAPSLESTFIEPGSPASFLDNNLSLSPFSSHYSIPRSPSHMSFKASTLEPSVRSDATVPIDELVGLSVRPQMGDQVQVAAEWREKENWERELRNSKRKVKGWLGNVRPAPPPLEKTKRMLNLAVDGEDWMDQGTEERMEVEEAEGEKKESGQQVVDKDV